MSSRSARERAMDSDIALDAALASPRFAADLASISPHDQPTVPYAAHSGHEADLSSEGERPAPPDAARITRRDLAIMVARRQELEAQVADLQNQIRAMQDSSAKRVMQFKVPARRSDIAREFSLDGVTAWVSVTPEGTVYMTADQIEQMRRDIEGVADQDEDFVFDAQDAIRDRDRSEAGYVKRKLNQDV